MLPRLPKVTSATTASSASAGCSAPAKSKELPASSCSSSRPSGSVMESTGSVCGPRPAACILASAACGSQRGEGCVRHRRTVWPQHNEPGLAKGSARAASSHGPARACALAAWMRQTLDTQHLNTPARVHWSCLWAAVVSSSSASLHHLNDLEWAHQVHHNVTRLLARLAFPPPHTHPPTYLQVLGLERHPDFHQRILTVLLVCREFGGGGGMHAQGLREKHAPQEQRREESVCSQEAVRARLCYRGMC